MSTDKIVRNSLWSFVDLAMSLVFAVVGSVAVARALGPEKLGYFNYVLWLTGIATLLGMLGIPMATLRFAGEAIGRGDPGQAMAVIRLTGRIQSATALAMTVLGVAACLTFSPRDEWGYTLIAVFSMFPGMVVGIFTQANMVMEEFRSNATASMVSNVVNFAGVVLALLLGWELIGLTAALLAARLVDLGLRYRAFRANYRSLNIAWPGFLGTWKEHTVPEETRKRIVSFCAHSFLLQLLDTLVWNRPQVYFLKQFSPISEVTFYTLGFNLTERAILLPRAFMGAITANLIVTSSSNAEGAQRRTAEASRYLALLSLPMLLGLSAVSWPLMEVFYGREYLPAALPFAILAASGVFRVALMPARAYLATMEQQRLLVWWSIFGAVLNIVLSVLWIPPNGAVGAAWASAVSQGVTIIGLWAMILKSFIIPSPLPNLLRLAIPAVLMLAAVMGWAVFAPPLPGLLSGIPLGVAVFAVVLRLTGGLTRVDEARLLGVAAKAPAFAGKPFASLITFLCAGGR